MTRQTARIREAYVLAVLAVVATACSGSDAATATVPATDPTTAANTTEPQVSPAIDAPATTQAATTEAPAPAVATDVTTEPPADFDPAGATLLAFEGRSLDPGRYLITTLGTPITAEVGENWAVFYNWDAETKLAVPEYELFGDREVRLIRPNLLADPANLTAPPLEQTPWPVDDINGWLERVIPGVVRGEPTTVELGQVTALRFDVRLEGIDCVVEFCAGFATNQLVTSSSFLEGVTWRVWWIDQGTYDPIAIVAGAGFDNEDFLESADELVESMRFGEPQPNPLGPPDSDAPIDPRLWEYGVDSLVPPGPIELPTGGGISFDLPVESRIFQRSGLAAITTDDFATEVDIWTPTATSAGAPIDTVDDLLDAIAELGLPELSVTPATDDGSVFDIRFDPNDEVPGGLDDDQYLVASVDSDVRWSPLAFTRLWVIDTDTGLLAITAEVRDEAQLADVAVIAEAIAQTIRFA